MRLQKNVSARIISARQTDVANTITMMTVSLSRVVALLPSDGNSSGAERH